MSEPILFSVDIGFDPVDTSNIYFISYADAAEVLKINTTTTPATSSVYMPAKAPVGSPAITLATHIQVDTPLDKMFLLEKSGSLYEIKISTGSRTKIEGISAQAITYDHDRHLLYFNEKTKNAIWVLDVVSGHKMLVSGTL